MKLFLTIDKDRFLALSERHREAVIFSALLLDLEVANVLRCWQDPTLIGSFVPFESPEIKNDTFKNIETPKRQ